MTGSPQLAFLLLLLSASLVAGDDSRPAPAAPPGQRLAGTHRLDGPAALRVARRQQVIRQRFAGSSRQAQLAGGTGSDFDAFTGLIQSTVALDSVWWSELKIMP